LSISICILANDVQELKPYKFKFKPNTNRMRKDFVYNKVWTRLKSRRNDGYICQLCQAATQMLKYPPVNVKNRIIFIWNKWFITIYATNRSLKLCYRQVFDTALLKISQIQLSGWFYVQLVHCTTILRERGVQNGLSEIQPFYKQCLFLMIYLSSHVDRHHLIN
jgi:hypothetical protein